MIQLKDYQKKAIKELKLKMIDMLNQSEDRQKLVFKAPTGSGKTVMASALLDELTQELPQNGDCIYTRVAWVWIAPNKLHQQSYRSMRNYFSETRSLRPVMFDECDHLEGLQQGDVLFLNWESINKDNAVMIRDNEQNRTLFELLRRTRIQNNVPIVVVIDEEHMFGGRNAMKSEKVLKSINPKIELRISATPVTMSFQAVEVRRKDVVEEEMIKKGVELNPNVRSSNEQTSLTVNQQLLVKALKKREELAKAYAEYGINPLLLIQLPNDTSDTLSNEEKTIAEEMKAYLSEMCNISVENGKLAVWLSKDKSPNLENITKADDMTEVLLFKQAIALGWDCPRASVLLIFRELKSMTFTTQTVGRILRMPEQRFYHDDRLNYGYVYTNLSEDIIQIVGDDMNYLSTIFANRRKDFNGITLRSVYQDKHFKGRNRLGADFRAFFLKMMETEWEQNPMMLFNEEDFFENDGEAGDNTHNEEEMEAKLVRNRHNAKKHGIQTDVSRIFVAIPKDTPMTGENGMVEIVDKARIALNASELDNLFTLFCRKNVGSFGKHDSTPVLKGAIEKALEDYLQIFETDVPKVVLYYKNRPHFEDLIRKAIARYAALQGAQEQETGDNAPYKEFTWEVPETRIYNAEKNVGRDGEIFNHALTPYFEQKNVSIPEYNFARWIDGQREVVDWWYKNGDEGKQHFAVPYTAQDGKDRCFYVDFVIRLKNGTICLLDTKTHGSDENGKEKNNALFEFVQTYREKGVSMYGGVLIQEGDNWYFPDGLVDNIDSTEGWKRLELNNI
jgi:type III restriction enzyme